MTENSWHSGDSNRHYFLGQNSLGHCVEGLGIHIDMCIHFVHLKKHLDYICNDILTITYQTIVSIYFVQYT